MSTSTTLSSIISKEFDANQTAAVIKMLLSIEGASWTTAVAVLEVLAKDAAACKRMVLIAPGGAYSITRKASDVFPHIVSIIESLPGFADHKITSRKEMTDSVNLSLFRLVSLAVASAMQSHAKVPSVLKTFASKAVQKQSAQAVSGGDEAKQIAVQKMSTVGAMTSEALNAATAVVSKAYP